MFDRWFDSFTEVVTAVAAAGVLIYLGHEIKRRQKKLRDLFYVLGPELHDHGRPPRRTGATRCDPPLSPERERINRWGGVLHHFVNRIVSGINKVDDINPASRGAANLAHLTESM